MEKHNPNKLLPVVIPSWFTGWHKVWDHYIISVDTATGRDIEVLAEIRNGEIINQRIIKNNT